MSIDTSGEWWKGSEAADLIEYLKAATAEGYLVDEIRPAIWDEAEPEEWDCIGCGSRHANVYVGFSLYSEGDGVRWLYIGVRCADCGILGTFGDWKIGYGPSLHLLDGV